MKVVIKTLYSVLIGTIKIPFAIALGIVLIVIFDWVICAIFNLGFKNGDDLYIDTINTDIAWKWFKKFGKLK